MEFGVYESGPRKSVFPPRTELRRGDWKTDSTSSTTSEQADGEAFIAGLQLAPGGLGNLFYYELDLGLGGIRNGGHLAWEVSLFLEGQRSF